MILVIGAGLAGLTCAKHLAEAGQQVLVLEAAEQVGGRVRTDRYEGYWLDRGFQVLFTAYPAAQHDLDYNALDLCRFAPEVLMTTGRKRYLLADPTRKPEHLLADLSNPLVSIGDKWKVIQLRQELVNRPLTEIFSGQRQDESTEQYLTRLGFAERGFIEHFARPFFGGIFLDRSLTTSARLFQFLFKMLACGDTVIPAQGMQRIPEQLAARLPAGSIRCHTRVRELLMREQKVHGVLLDNGEKIEADQVVVATESPEAARLTGCVLPTEGVGSTCLYFAGDEPLYREPALVVSASGEGRINHVVLLSNIAPTYAPTGKHLLSVTVLGNTERDDERLARSCLTELEEWFPEHDLSRWKFLAAYRIPFSQFAQRPGIFDQLPGNRTHIAGLYLAGEYTESSSIQGAMHSGACAARAVVEMVR